MSAGAMLTGVLLVAHGNYGRLLVGAAEALLGPLEVDVFEVPAVLDAAEVQRQILEHASRLDLGGGVLLLSDLWGSTPCNVCLSMVAERPLWRLVTGLNLAMLIKLATCDRRLRPADLAREVVETSRRSIRVCGGAPGEE